MFVMSLIPAVESGSEDSPEFGLMFLACFNCGCLSLPNGAQSELPSLHLHPFAPSETPACALTVGWSGGGGPGWGGVGWGVNVPLPSFLQMPLV